MTKKQKELIAKAKPYSEDEYDNIGMPRIKRLYHSIYIINSGRKYNGTFGKGPWRNLIVIGVEDVTKELYVLTQKHCDVLSIKPLEHNDNFESFNYEISTDDECISLWLEKPSYFEVQFFLSTLILKMVINNHAN